MTADEEVVMGVVVFEPDVGRTVVARRACVRDGCGGQEAEVEAKPIITSPDGREYRWHLCLTCLRWGCAGTTPAEWSREAASPFAGASA